MRQSKCKTFHEGARVEALTSWAAQNVDTKENSLSSKYVVVITKIEEDVRHITKIINFEL